MDSALPPTTHPPTVSSAPPPANGAVPLVWGRVGRLIWEPVALTVVYTLLAILFTWPLAAHLGDGIVSLLDPLDSVWRVAQGQQQVLHAPTRLFEANIFYPYPRTYLFDELLLGAVLLTLPLRLVTENPVLIYNVAVLSTFVLSALGMHALARRLGCGTLAAGLAAVSYAFAPFHLDHLPHLGLLSGQYFPLIILFLDRLFVAPRWRDACALAGFLSLQAYSAQYYAFYLVFVVGGFVGLRLLLDRLRGQWPARRTWAGLLVAGGVAALLFLPLALGYRSVQQDFAFERTADENIFYSANLTSFVTVDERNRLWGQATAIFREQGRYTPERNSFPGLVVLALAVVGTVASWRRPLARYLILLGLGSAALALGPGLHLTGDPQSLIWGRMPYGFLYYRLPGFDSMRVPARFNILYGLSVAGLAGLGLQWLLGRVGAVRLERRSWRRALPLAVGGVLIAAVIAESLSLPYTINPLPTGGAVPPVYRWLAAQPEAVLIELPFVVSNNRSAELLNNRYQYYALYHGRPVVNGAGNVAPKGYKALAYDLRGGLTPRVLTILQGLDVTHLVVHYDQLDRMQAAQTRALLAQANCPAKEVATFGSDVAYRLEPSDRLAQLRALIPPGATIYLSREDASGAYGGMLTRVLQSNPVFSRVRVEYGRDAAGPPDPAARYDFAILYRQENPANVGFAGATVAWEDDVVRVYRR